MWITSSRALGKLPTGAHTVDAEPRPVGRQIEHTYAAIGIDLLEVRNTTAGRKTYFR